MSEVHSNTDPGVAEPHASAIFVASRPPIPPYGDVQDDLVRFWSMLWHERSLLCLIIVVCTVVATAYALLSPEWFRSQALLIPATPKSNQGRMSQLGGLGGFASLAGINLSGRSNASEPIAVLKSRDFVREFIEKNDLLPILYSDKWDAVTARWKDTGVSRTPDLRDAEKYFLDNVLSVEEDKKTGFVTVAVEWTDAVKAATWTNLLVDRINERMRDRDLVDAEAHTVYLQNQLATTNIAALQQAISDLLETELQKLMLARGNKEFAFRIIDRPEVAKHRSRPKLGLTVALGFLAGGIIGVIVVLVRKACKSAVDTTNRRR